MDRTLRLVCAECRKPIEIVFQVPEAVGVPFVAVAVKPCPCQVQSKPEARIISKESIGKFLGSKREVDLHFLKVDGQRRSILCYFLSVNGDADLLYFYDTEADCIKSCRLKNVIEFRTNGLHFIVG